jgi:hypothetical protein
VYIFIIRMQLALLGCSADRSMPTAMLNNRATKSICKSTHLRRRSPHLISPQKAMQNGSRVHKSSKELGRALRVRCLGCRSQLYMTSDCMQPSNQTRGQALNPTLAALPLWWLLPVLATWPRMYHMWPEVPLQQAQRTCAPLCALLPVVQHLLSQQFCQPDLIDHWAPPRHCSASPSWLAAQPITLLLH